MGERRGTPLGETRDKEVSWLGETTVTGEGIGLGWITLEPVWLIREGDLSTILGRGRGGRGWVGSWAVSMGSVSLSELELEWLLESSESLSLDDDELSEEEEETLLIFLKTGGAACAPENPPLPPVVGGWGVELVEDAFGVGVTECLMLENGRDTISAGLGAAALTEFRVLVIVFVALPADCCLATPFWLAFLLLGVVLVVDLLVDCLVRGEEEEEGLESLATVLLDKKNQWNFACYNYIMLELATMYLYCVLSLPAFGSKVHLQNEYMV